MDNGSLHQVIPAVEDHYTKLGYHNVTNVPQVVPAEIMNATKPADVPEISAGHHVIASGEQGLLYMLTEGCMDDDPREICAYQCTTMCRRPHDANKGHMYLEWFLKVELMVVGTPVPEDILYSVLGAAAGLYTEILGDTPRVVSTDEGLDLVYNTPDVEIGSYGIRSYGDFQWVYGTGFVPYRTALALEDSPDHPLYENLPPC